MRKRILRMAMLNTGTLLVLVLLTGAGASGPGDGGLLMRDQSTTAQKVGHVDFVPTAGDGSTLAAVTFRFSPNRDETTELSIRLEPKGAWYRCTDQGSVVLCPTAGTPIELEDVVELQVVAT